MGPIKEAPRQCAYFEIGFSLKSNKYLQTSLEHAMNRACELSMPHASTRLCSSSLCVSMLCFAACSQPSLPLMEPPMGRLSRWRVGGESSRVSCRLFCVATRVVFSTTRALTLLCVIWTEAHTPRQVKMTVWPYFHVEDTFGLPQLSFCAALAALA